MNAFLYRELRKYYALLYEAELDPLGLSYFQEGTSSPPEDKPILVFFGDSRAAQWTAPHMDGFTFLNRGIGNQTSAQVLLRFDLHITPLQPDVIILQVCINDLKTIPLFPARKAEIVTNCKSNIEQIIQRSTELNASVILTTVFPTSGNVPPARRLVWSEDIYSAIEEVNEFILSYENEKVIVFDTASLLSNDNGNTKEKFVYDLLHLNTAGYEAINPELVKILESLK